MKQLWWVWSGRCGLAGWWVCQSVLYLGVGSAPVVYLHVFHTPASSAGDLLIWIAASTYFGLPWVLATILLTGLAWKLRRLPRLKFRVAVVGLIGLPLLCMPDLRMLSFAVPVQLCYAILLTRPVWTDPIEREHTEFVREHFPADP